MPFISQCVSQNFWQMVSEVHFKFQNFARNLTNSLCNCQSNREGKLRISCWILLGSCEVEVRIIQCSWCCNINTNGFKQSEKYSPLSKAYFMMFISEFLKCKLFERYRGTPYHRQMAWLTSGLQQKCEYNSSTQHWKCSVFRAISRMTYAQNFFFFLIDLSCKLHCS